LKGTEDLKLYYIRSLVRYVDARYRSDHATSKFQTCYVFLRHGVTIFWKSTITATSSNHTEIIALHKASKECIWLRSTDKFICSNSGLPYKESLTVLYKDKNACITQMQVGFIKGHHTKYIDPKYFSFTNDLITDST